MIQSKHNDDKPQSPIGVSFDRPDSADLSLEVVLADVRLVDLSPQLTRCHKRVFLVPQHSS